MALPPEEKVGRCFNSFQELEVLQQGIQEIFKVTFDDVSIPFRN